MSGTSDDELNRVEALLRDHYGPERPDAEEDVSKELELVLLEEDASLFRGINSETHTRMRAIFGDSAIPEDTKSEIAIAKIEAPIVVLDENARAARARFSRRLKIGASLTALAAGISLILWVAPGDPLAPSGTYEPVIGGAVATQRGGPGATEEIPRFAPDSTLAVEFTEPKRAGELLATTVRLFLVDEDGRLQPVDAKTTRVEDSTKVIFSVEAKAGAALGATSGIKVLAFAFATTERLLSDLAGENFERAKLRPGIRWVSRRVEFVQPSGWRDVRLYRYTRLVRTEHGLLPIFTRSELPRLRVRGDAGEPWSVWIVAGSREPMRVEVSSIARSPYLLLDVVAVPEGIFEASEVQIRFGEEIISKFQISWAKPPDEDPIIRRARNTSDENSRAELIAALEKARAAGAWTRYFAEVELGRIARNAGELSEAWSFWDAARATAELLDSPTDVAGRLRSMAYLDLQSTEFVRAQKELEKAKQITDAIGDEAGSGKALYLEALLLERMSVPNSPFEAQKRYREAINAARLRGDDQDARTFALLLATLMASYDDVNEARALLDAHPPPAGGREELDYLLHRMDIERIAFEQLAPNPEVAKQLKQQALVLLARTTKEGRPSDTAHVLMTLIRHELALGELEDAAAHAAALSLIPEQSLESARWMRPLLIAEVELARGRTHGTVSRLRSFQEMVRRANGQDLDVSVVAEILIADAQRLAGDRTRAYETYRQALRNSVQLAQRFATPKARGLYRLRRRAAEQQMVAILLDERRDEDALSVIESSRLRAIAEIELQARTLSTPELAARHAQLRSELEVRYRGECDRSGTGLDCRRRSEALAETLNTLYAASWPVRLEERPFDVRALLRALPTKHALLTIAELPVGQVVFLTRDGIVRSSRVTGDFLGPWRAEIAALDRLYISADHTERVQDLIFEKLGDGRTLGAGVETIFVVHSPPRSHDRHLRTGALIVADPSSDLPEALAEGKILARSWANAEQLFGSNATRSAVLARWRGLDVFHFAGHGRPFAGDLRTTLDLAATETLHIDDILFERPAPRLVVLSGCTTSGGAQPAQIGLPHAFLAGGSQYVLATTSVLKDAQARNFVERFYANGGLENPALGYRRTLDEIGSRPETAILFRLWGTLPDG